MSVRHWRGEVKQGGSRHLFGGPEVVDGPCLPVSARALCGTFVEQVQWGSSHSRPIVEGEAGDCPVCVRRHNQRVARPEPEPIRSTVRDRWGSPPSSYLSHVFPDPAVQVGDTLTLPPEGWSRCGINFVGVSWGTPVEPTTLTGGLNDCPRCVRLHNEAVEAAPAPAKADPEARPADVHHPPHYGGGGRPVRGDQGHRGLGAGVQPRQRVEVRAAGGEQAGGRVGDGSREGRLVSRPRTRDPEEVAVNTMSEPTFLEACREVPRGDRPQLRVEVGLLGPKAEPAVLLRGSVWGRSKRWHHVVHQGKRKAGESLKDARARMERLAERFRLYLDRWRLGQEAKEAELERTIEGVR